MTTIYCILNCICAYLPSSIPFQCLQCVLYLQKIPKMVQCIEHMVSHTIPTLSYPHALLTNRTLSIHRDRGHYRPRRTRHRPSYHRVRTNFIRDSQISCTKQAIFWFGQSCIDCTRFPLPFLARPHSLTHNTAARFLKPHTESRVFSISRFGYHSNRKIPKF